ncbi:hypothetical protein ACFQXA_17210 [Nocardiopsis composta]
MRRRLSGAGGSAAAIAIAMLWTVPTAGLLVSSFRPEQDIKTTGWWTFFSSPELTLRNYRDVLFGSSSDGRLASYFVNSFVITVPTMVFVVLLAALAAYCLAWMRFPGRDWVFIGIFALQIVPLQMSLVPLLRLFSEGWRSAAPRCCPPGSCRAPSSSPPCGSRTPSSGCRWASS